MGDLDDFKRINDTLGHLAGDEVLRSAAAAMSGRVRGGHVIARFGGEEFIVAVPVAGPERVLELAEQMRAAIAARLAPYDASMSFGVAHLRPDDTLDALVDRADKALYSAKYAGKNRVHEWCDAADTPTPVEAAAEERRAA
jgi:diguanylate cyclase (GGDEF)-like protein